VVSMGKDTYYVERGGWPHMNQYALEAKCLRDANRYCESHHLAMEPVSSVGREGEAFQHNATFRLIFKAVSLNTQTDKPPVK
jgi:hypothetical protein